MKRRTMKGFTMRYECGYSYGARVVILDENGGRRLGKVVAYQPDPRHASYLIRTREGDTWENEMNLMPREDWDRVVFRRLKHDTSIA